MVLDEKVTSQDSRITGLEAGSQLTHSDMNDVKGQMQEFKTELADIRSSNEKTEERINKVEEKQKAQKMAPTVQASNRRETRYTAIWLKLVGWLAMLALVWFVICLAVLWRNAADEKQLSDDKQRFELKQEWKKMEARVKAFEARSSSFEKRVQEFHNERDAMAVSQKDFAALKKEFGATMEEQLHSFKTEKKKLNKQKIELDQLQSELHRKQDWLNEQKERTSFVDYWLGVASGAFAAIAVGWICTRK